MNKKQLTALKTEIQQIRSSDKIDKQKILNAINCMPWINNKNVRHAYAEISSLIYDLYQ